MFCLTCAVQVRADLAPSFAQFSAVDCAQGGVQRAHPQLYSQQLHCELLAKLWGVSSCAL